MPKELSARTLGELAIMRDALTVARSQIQRTAIRGNELSVPLLRILDVLDAIVGDRPIQRKDYEYEQLRAR
jgi:hypothetical protein